MATMLPVTGDANLQVSLPRVTTISNENQRVDDCQQPMFDTSWQHLATWQISIMNLLTFSTKCASRCSGMHFLNISTSKSVTRLSVIFTILTCKSASRHCGMQFLLIGVTTDLQTHGFTERTFQPSRSTACKTQHFPQFPPVTHARLP